MLVEGLQSKTAEIQQMIELAWDMGHNAHGRERDRRDHGNQEAYRDLRGTG